MQLRVSHKVQEPLRLPLNYHHIIQSVIFYALNQESEYSEFLHDKKIIKENLNFSHLVF